MITRLIIVGALLGGLLGCDANVDQVFDQFNRPAPRVRTAKVIQQSLAVWSTFQGAVEARKVTTIMSKLPRNAIVVELVPEGARVSKGDGLVRFDSSALERELLKLERDYLSARAEADSVLHAKQPLELRALRLKLLETEANLAAEQEYLSASAELLKEGLVSGPEVEQQKLKVAKIKEQLDALKQQIALTRQYVHPSELERLIAKVAAGEQEMKLIREQLRNTVVMAPTDGVVVYNPIHVGTEFRTIRIGDTVFENQPFILLPDMTDLVVRCDVPEAEISRIREGNPGHVEALAYPGLRIEGKIETVGSVAQALPGRPNWQKFVSIGIGLKGVDSRVKPGMSVTAHVLSYYRQAALLVPRASVQWNSGTSFVRVPRGDAYETRRVKLGQADEKSYEVIEGLKAGEEVLLE